MTPPGLRILAGAWRARRLPAAGPGVRPTSARVREAALSMIADHIGGACVLDLFAGTGALGLEALSRGAGACDLVEADPAAVRALEGTLRDLGAAGARVIRADATAPGGALAGRCYDLILLDPPWGQGLAGRALEAAVLAGVVAQEAVALVVHGATEPVAAAGWASARRRRHGDAGITVLERTAEAP